MAIPKIMKDIFWKNPFLSVEQKDQLYYELKKLFDMKGSLLIQQQQNRSLKNILRRFWLFRQQGVRSIVIFLILDLKDSLRIRN